MIPQSKIDEIVHAAHIEDVVGDYVSLRKRGANLLGLCPFHQEKTPSFNVSPSKGIFKCFGCGKGGNAVNFIMEYEHLNYIEALKHLAGKYQIDWPEENLTDEALAEEQRKRNEKDSLQIINNFAQEYFEHVLHDDEEGRMIGLSYFEERGFRPETIRKFRLGFAKESWDEFTQTALKSGYNEALLLASGLIKRSDQGKVYDAYRNRVIFTIHGLNGKPIAFAGRILKAKDEKSPKYVNSPETVLYHKSNELYGLYFARTAISKADYVYLVEGYTDVITMHQAGVENVVASSGTSLTENQIRLIRRFTENVCVLYDGDAAGIKASMRGIDMLLEGGLNVKVLLFPDGEDPDSYCKKSGPVAFTEFLEKNKQDFILFKTGLLAEEAGNDPVKRAGLIRNIVESIAKIPDAFKRSNFVRECSRILKADEQLLVNETNRLIRTKYASEAKTELASPPDQVLNYEEEIAQLVELQSQETQEKDLLRVLVKYGGKPYPDKTNAATYIFEKLEKETISIEQPVIARCFELLHEQLSSGQFEPAQLMQHADTSVTAMMAELMTDKHELSPNWEHRYDIYIEPADDRYLLDIEAALAWLTLKHIDKLIRHNQEDFNRVTDEVEIHNLQHTHMNLLAYRKELSRRFGTAIIR